ncbi:MAG: tetratricopeptide repeat protein, partial [Chloroflexia bacterium]
RAVFDSSWALLAEEERRALARLSVFRGGFQREAAKEVAGVSLPVLSALLDKSLLRCTAGRYEILETLRQYAEEKLQEMAGEPERVRDLHGLFYIRFLQEREKPLKAGKEEEALQEIHEEHENILEAWRWSVEQGRWAEIGRAAESLYLFYEMRSLFHEGEQVFRQTLEALRKLPGGDNRYEAALGRVLARYGWCCERLGRYPEAREFFSEALSIARRLGDAEEATFDAAHLGAVYRLLGEYDLARRSLQESLDLGRESGQTWPQAHAFLNLGIVISAVGEYEGARRAFQESLDLFRKIGYRRGIAAALNNLGLEASALGDYEEARRLFQESLSLFQEIGDHRRTAFALANLGYISGNQGQHAEAERLGLEALAIFREIGEQWAVCTVLSNLGASACAQGKYPAARRYLLESLRVARELQAVPRVLDILADLADVLYGEGSPSEALEVLAVVLRHPAVEEGTREHAGRLLEKLREELSPGVVAVALEQAEAGDWEEVLRKFIS